jgi:protein SCO1
MPSASPSMRLNRIRLLAWLLAAIALFGLAAAALFMRHQPTDSESHFGGSFTLVSGDGRPFSSESLLGKPYAIYFGFTRCGDVCPTTLSRLVRLRRAAASDGAMSIVFVTIDPANDGPRQVGLYAQLFGAPIIGLTGTKVQMDKVKKQYGIYAEPVPNAPMGQQMMHTATVLLFDRTGSFSAIISPDEPDSSALEKIKRLTV